MRLYSEHQSPNPSTELFQEDFCWHAWIPSAARCRDPAAWSHLECPRWFLCSPGSRLKPQGGLSDWPSSGHVPQSQLHGRLVTSVVLGTFYVRWMSSPKAYKIEDSPNTGRNFRCCIRILQKNKTSKMYIHIHTRTHITYIHFIYGTYIYTHFYNTYCVYIKLINIIIITNYNNIINIYLCTHTHIKGDLLHKLVHRVMEVAPSFICKLETQESHWCHS